MRSLLRNLFFFLFIPLGFSAIFESLIWAFKSPLFQEATFQKVYSEDFNKYKWIENIHCDSLSILAGSSSVKYGLSCSVLNTLANDNSKYVNIAKEARDPIQTYFILKQLDFKNIDVVYFGLDPWIYSRRYYKFRNNYLYLDFNFLQCFYFALEQDKKVFFKRYQCLIDFALKKKASGIAPNYEIPDDFGSTTLDRTAVNFTDLGDWFELRKYGWSELQFVYLKKTQDLCRKRNIQFVLFLPPKRSDFSTYYAQDCHDINVSYQKELSRYGISAPIFGKFDQLDKVGDSLLFVEAYHLNKIGQIKYSEIFYDISKNATKQNIKNYAFSQNPKYLSAPEKENPETRDF